MPNPDELRADCARCAALCCVATTFDRSPDFGCSKAAGVPCVHLTRSDRCGIHARRVEAGFPGCLAYDCYGAGQHLTRTVLRGASWRDRDRGDVEIVFEAFRKLCVVQERLAVLTIAAGLEVAGPLRPAIQARITRLDALRTGDAEQLAALDVEAERRAVEDLLIELRALCALRAGRAVAG